MTSLFPTPYPDELFYSICARYHFKSRNVGNVYTMTDLFGSRSAKAILDFPNRLDELCSKFPDGTSLTSDYFINSHTLYPIYQPFLKLGNVNRLIESMKGHQRNYKEIATSGNVKPPGFIRYCLECVEEDEIKWGEPYWHRSHQITGVELCPIHFCWLRESDIPFKTQNFYQVLDLKSIRTQKSSVKINYEYYDHYKAIAQDFYWLLNNKVTILGEKEIVEKYIYYLRQKRQLVTVSGQVRQRELVQSLEDFYDVNFLGEINCNDVEKWLIRLFNNYKSMTHPLRHLLIIRYLGLTAKDFFQDETVANFKPFGEGPWFCLNPVCDSYHQPVIEEYHLRQSTRHSFVGIFSCKCGFRYSRYGPDKEEADRYRLSNVLSYGSLWESELLRLVKQGEMTREQIARHFKVSRGTIYLHLKRLNSKSVQTESDLINERDKYRNHWLKFISENDRLTKKAMRKNEPTVSNWLMKNDCKWFDDHTPKKSSGSSRGYSVDWKARDEELVILVNKASVAIREKNGKPFRVTMHGISNYIGKAHYFNKKYYIDKLPKTMEVLKTVVESVEQYQLRNVKWIAAELRRDGIEVTQWRIIQKLGYQGKPTNKVIDAIENEVELYSAI